MQRRARTGHVEESAGDRRYARSTAGFARSRRRHPDGRDVRSRWPCPSAYVQRVPHLLDRLSSGVVGAEILDALHSVGDEPETLVEPAGPRIVGDHPEPDLGEPMTHEMI